MLWCSCAHHTLVGHHASLLLCPIGHITSHQSSAVLAIGFNTSHLELYCCAADEVAAMPPLPYLLTEGPLGDYDTDVTTALKISKLKEGASQLPFEVHMVHRVFD